MGKINLCVQPMEFFQQQVSNVLVRQKIKTPQEVEVYLVDLLARFMFTTNLFDSAKDDGAKDQEPLALLLLKSQEKSVQNGEKIRMLKKLGDTSLYISGFFGDSLNRKVIDLDYYREMGSIAYRSLSETIKENTFQELYTELHNKFSAFVDVLAEVASEAQVKSNDDLLRLYEVYLRTGSEVARKKLAEKGLPTEGVKNPSSKITKN